MPVVQSTEWLRNAKTPTSTSTHCTVQTKRCRCEQKVSLVQGYSLQQIKRQPAQAVVVGGGGCGRNLLIRRSVVVGLPAVAQVRDDELCLSGHCLQLFIVKVEQCGRDTPWRHLYVRVQRALAGLVPTRVLLGHVCV